MVRPKTALRLRIEEFLKDTEEQWMSVQCESYRQAGIVRSMANNMKSYGYPIGIVEYDKQTKLLWIEHEGVK